MFHNTEPSDYGLALYLAKQQQAERVRFRQSTGWDLSKAREVVRQAAEWLARRYDREGELCAQGLTPACEMHFG